MTDDNQEVLPAWLMDGKGIRGDAQPPPESGLNFPPAQITNVEPQVAISSAPLGNSPGGFPKSTLPVFPFAIIFQGTPSTPVSYQYGVIHHSTLFQNANIEEPSSLPVQTISGLLASDAPAATDPGWITWNGEDDPVWLELQVASGPAVSSATIVSYSNGGGVDGDYGGGEVENGGNSTQTVARTLIGIVSDSGNGTPVVRQFIRTHLKLALSTRDSFDENCDNEQQINAIYPVAFPGAVITKSPASADFSLYDAGPDGDGNPRLGINNGTVTGPGFAALPSGMTAGGVPAYAQGVGGTDQYAWIEVDWDVSDPTNPTVTSASLNTGISVPANTSSTQYIPLGDFSVSGTAITVGSGAVGIGSQTVFDCNGTFQQGAT